jgi:preprotein translocase subunit SecG
LSAPGSVRRDRYTRGRRTGRPQAAARARNLDPLAKVGFVARGVVYILIGVLALAIALGKPAPQADRTGALQAVATHPFGTFVLWLLVIGFAAMALWRFAQAYYGVHRRGARGGEEALAAARGVLYTVFFIGTLRYVIGLPPPSSTNQQTHDFTTTAMAHSYGRALVLLVGVVIAVIGLVMIKIGASKSFLKDLQLSQASRRTREGVTWLGTVGNIARGLVFAGIGAFMIDAAVTFDAAKAKGIDATLRTFAHTPVGPLLLGVVAVGLALFGVYSLAEARWHRRI